MDQVRGVRVLTGHRCKGRLDYERHVVLNVGVDLEYLVVHKDMTLLWLLRLLAAALQGRRLNRFRYLGLFYLVFGRFGAQLESVDA